MREANLETEQRGGQNLGAGQWPPPSFRRKALLDLDPKTSAHNHLKSARRETDTKIRRAAKEGPFISNSRAFTDGTRHDQLTFGTPARVPALSTNR